LNLKELIDKKKTTMYKLAKETNLGQSTINEIVNGKRKSIRLETAAKIADFLNVDLRVVKDCIGGDNNGD